VRRILLKAIIHRATVNEANVDYEGSITIDENLTGAATHQANKDDVLLIASYSLLDDEIILHQPKLPYVDKNNRE